MPKYYPIDEDAARRDHENHHMITDFRPGDLTADYRAAVDAFYSKCEAAKANCRPGREKQLDDLADRYARRLADNINAQSRAGARHVAWFIAGPSNYDMRKQEKYSSRMDTLFRERQAIDDMEKEIDRAAGDPSIILSGDPDAIEQLTDKLHRLEAAQETMKRANDYWRKHGTLDGFPDLPADFIRDFGDPFRPNGAAPFTGWPLQNNLANIKRTRERLEKLKAAKAATPAAVTVEATDDEHPGYTYKENTDAMRVQFIFDGKPDAATRDLLKQNGFRWAPSQNAWQRQLTPNGKRAAAAVMAALKANA